MLHVQAVNVMQDGKTAKPGFVMCVSLSFAITEVLLTLLPAVVVHATTHQWQLEPFVRTAIPPNVTTMDIPILLAHLVFVITDIQEISVIPVQLQISLLFQFHVFLEVLLIIARMRSVTVTQLFTPIKLLEIYASQPWVTYYL